VKTALCILVSLVGFAAGFCAPTAIVVEIRTSDTGVTYAVNGKVMKADELEAWLRTTINAFGADEPFLLSGDDRTSFKAVVDVLKLFKRAGVKFYEVYSIAETANGSRVRESVSGTTDGVKSEATSAPLPGGHN